MVKFGWDKLKRFLAQANSWTGTQTFSSIAVTGGTISGAVITDQFTTSTNPASSAAVTTAIVDAYNGVVITTNVNNAQTIAAPTAATVKTFKVINNDTSSSAITVNGITLAAGKGQTFTYDGSAWGPTDIGITAIPVPVAEGGTGVSTSGALTEIPIGGGTTSPIVWTAATGTGAPVRATSPTLVTPLLGTPTSGVLTNATGLPLAGLVPGTAESDFICATTTPFTWVKKTLVEAKALLGLVITAGKTITATQSITLDMAGNLSDLLQQFYGVSWNESADTYVRTGATAGQANAVTLADAFLPIQRRMRGCLLSNAGTVNYYLSATDWTKKEDGATASVLTGADGQVMVQIPKFWYRYGYAGTTHTWEVSPVPLAGFDPHPAFYKDGAWVDYRYIGAYEGVLYDNSLTAYVDGIYQTAVSCVFALTGSTMTIASRSNWATNLTVGQKIVVSGTVSNNGTFTVASKVSGTQITTTEALVNETAASTVISTERDYTATTGDKLSSVSGKAAINQLTRANLRIIALNRGTGWRQQDYDLTWAIQLLFIIEYASFYSQSVLGAGISNVADWAAYNDSNPIALSGNGNSIGNANGNNTGSTSAATESTKYLKYRGIENFYGHLWKFVDGFNINDNIPYRTNVGANFADDTTTNYTRMVDSLGIDVTLHNANGYPATIQKMKWGFLAASVGASGSTKITDYYWQAAGWRVALFGGYANHGVYDGFAFWALLHASGGAAQGIVGRLGF